MLDQEKPDPAAKATPVNQSKVHPFFSNWLASLAPAEFGRQLAHLTQTATPPFDQLLATALYPHSFTATRNRIKALPAPVLAALQNLVLCACGIASDQPVTIDTATARFRWHLPDTVQAITPAALAALTPQITPLDLQLLEANGLLARTDTGVQLHPQVVPCFTRGIIAPVLVHNPIVFEPWRSSVDPDTPPLLLINKAELTASFGDLPEAQLNSYALLFYSQHIDLRSELDLPVLPSSAPAPAISGKPAAPAAAELSSQLSLQAVNTTLEFISFLQQVLITPLSLVFDRGSFGISNAQLKKLARGLSWPFNPATCHKMVLFLRLAFSLELLAPGSFSRSGRRVLTAGPMFRQWFTKTLPEQWRLLVSHWLMWSPAAPQHDPKVHNLSAYQPVESSYDFDRTEPSSGAQELIQVLAVKGAQGLTLAEAWEQLGYVNGAGLWQLTKNDDFAADSCMDQVLPEAELLGLVLVSPEQVLWPHPQLVQVLPLVTGSGQAEQFWFPAAYQLPLLVQSDLTVIVPGLPSAGQLALLAACARLETPGFAATWRLDAAMIANAEMVLGLPSQLLALALAAWQPDGRLPDPAAMVFADARGRQLLQLRPDSPSIPTGVLAPDALVLIGKPAVLTQLQVPVGPIPAGLNQFFEQLWQFICPDDRPLPWPADLAVGQVQLRPDDIRQLMNTLQEQGLELTSGHVSAVTQVAEQAAAAPWVSRLAPLTAQLQSTGSTSKPPLFFAHPHPELPVPWSADQLAQLQAALAGAILGHAELAAVLKDAAAHKSSLRLAWFEKTEFHCTQVTVMIDNRIQFFVEYADTSAWVSLRDIVAIWPAAS